jgi:rRNA maturation RNase YbeY
MRRINRKYLRHASDTDVLTFPLEEDSGIEGEIYVNLDRARRQADEEGVPLGEEVARLVIHGALHLIGYDDRKKKLAAIMKKEENKQVRHWFSHEGRDDERQNR